MGDDPQSIADATGTDLVNLRRTIYLTIMSSLDFEEAGHKLLKMQIPAGLVGCFDCGGGGAGCVEGGGRAARGPLRTPPARVCLTMLSTHSGPNPNPRRARSR
jgi:hypothetical protein